MSSEELPQRKVAFQNDDDDDDEDSFSEHGGVDDDEEEEEEEGDITDLLSNTLMTPDGETLCGTLVKISDTLETQNKILIKLLSTLAKRT